MLIRIYEHTAIMSSSSFITHYPYAAVDDEVLGGVGDAEFVQWIRVGRFTTIRHRRSPPPVSVDDEPWNSLSVRSATHAHNQMLSIPDPV